MISQEADSLERRKYHEWITKILPLFSKDSIVYDIGKSHKYDYSKVFNQCKYRSIDNNITKAPDFLIDFEDINQLSGLEKADLILCNGVVEQCNNPFDIVKNCLKLLNDKGYLLFGSVLTGFPVYNNDYFRFTENGAKRLFKNIVSYEVVSREGITAPTYIYILCRRD